MCQFPHENLIKIWYNSVQKECKQSLSLFYFSCCKRACPLHSVHWWVGRDWWDKNCPRSSAIFQNDPESVACWIGWVSTCFLSCGSFFGKDQFYTFERIFLWLIEHYNFILTETQRYLLSDVASFITTELYLKRDTCMHANVWCVSIQSLIRITFLFLLFSYEL